LLFVLPPTDPVQISELLCKTIADAHARTCLYSTEHIQDMFRKPHDLTKVVFYKNMVMHRIAEESSNLSDPFVNSSPQAHEELWLECAQKLTTVIQQIIEFAKMVPGFMKLSQDDQIVLLKAGTQIVQKLKKLFPLQILNLIHGCNFFYELQVASSWLL
jgi:nuclear receptor subfamily 1 group F member 4